jgi:TPR repeat protein
MTKRPRKPDWNRVVAGLRRGVAAGDTQAMTELGLTLFEGIQDRSGRALVRRNSRYAVSLFRRAAHSDASAALSLAYAYDIGAGTRRNTTLALQWYRRAVRMGESSGASNMAAVYRAQGKLGLAHRWALRAVEMGHGDAAVTAGYGRLYGIGVRANAGSARRLFRHALRSKSISAYGREEALYHLAVADLDSGQRRRAIQQLRRANGAGASGAARGRKAGNSLSLHASPEQESARSRAMPAAPAIEGLAVASKVTSVVT